MNKMNIIKGRIIKGNQLGKIMNFPTANMKFSKEEGDKLNLETGVFATSVKINSDLRNAISSVSKTKNGSYIIETHVLDIHKGTNYYDYDMEIAFIHKVREAMLFTSKEDLCHEIVEDGNKVRDYFKNRKTCETCQLCYQQDEGYSNYTVTDSNVGCYVDKFQECDSYNPTLTSYILNIAENCDSYTKGEMWYLDVEGEELGPSDEQIKIWKRESKINNLLN